MEVFTPGVLFIFIERPGSSIIGHKLLATRRLFSVVSLLFKGLSAVMVIHLDCLFVDYVWHQFNSRVVVSLSNLGSAQLMLRVVSLK